MAETFECPREVGDVAVLLTCPPGERREKGKREREREGGGGGNEGVGGRREGRRQNMEEMEREW